jgi:hypothetical protein
MEAPMRPTEKLLRELAAQQECQVEIRMPQNDAQHTFTRNWSPAVAAGLLALMILSAVTWIVTFVSAIR